VSPPPDQISDKHIEDAIGAAEIRLNLRPERNLGGILDVHTYDCGRTSSHEDWATMGVTGIGGFAFRARDPKALAAWYAEHLGGGGGEHGSWDQQARLTVFPLSTQTLTISRRPSSGC